MQTFLPSPSFEESARCLDDRRLRSQRNEALVILRTLLGEYESGGWPRHPAVKMWRGYEGALIRYALAVCDQLERRGCATGHTDPAPFHELARRHKLNPDTAADPPWVGDDRLHASHRAALLAKNPNWYGRFNWPEQPAKADSRGSLPYFWPEAKKEKKDQPPGKRKT